MNRPETFKDLYSYLSNLKKETIEKNRAKQKDYALGYLQKAFTANPFKKIILGETAWEENFEKVSDEICAAGFIVSKEEDNTVSPSKNWYSISIE